MVATLDERDGWLYVKDIQLSLTEPKQTACWWPLEVRFADFAHRFASQEEARKRLGRPMTYLRDGVYRDEQDLQYRLINGGQTRARFTEVTDIPEPPQRGRKLPTAWRHGGWYKQTSRGWKPM